MSNMLQATGCNESRTSGSSRLGVWQRLIWKDFRELLPVWVVILAGAALCLLLINANPLSGGRYDPSLKGATLICCQGFAVLTCVVNGVLLFALEKEKRTHQLLCGLPLKPNQVIISKQMVGLLGAYVAITLLAWGGAWITYAASGSMPDTGLLLEAGYARQWMLLTAPVLFFLIGACAALLAGSTVNAFVIATFFILFAALGTTYVGIDQNVNRTQNIRLVGAVLGLIIILTVVVTANGRRWMEGRPFKLPFRYVSKKQVLADVSADQATTRRPSQSFPVLMWQSWRIALPKLGLFVVFLIGLSLPWFLNSKGGDNDLFFAAGMYYVTSIVVGLQLLFSATIFQADHQSLLYRFFQQHVERPCWFWLTRLAPWVLTMLAIAVLWTFGITRIANEYLWLQNADVVERFFQYLLANGGAFATIILLTAVAIGQFWSMFVRNFVIAIVFSLISGGIVFWCVGWMIFMGESLTFYLFPLVAILFWATWYRARYWLADDRSWLGYVVPISAIAATIVLLFIGFNYHRANEIPEPQIDLNNIAKGFCFEINRDLQELQFDKPAKRSETAKLYRQSLQKVKTISFEEMASADQVRQLWDAVKRRRDLIERGSIADTDLTYPDFDQRVRKFVVANQTAIELILEASKRVGCDPFLDPDDSDLRFQQANKLRSLMIAWALVQLEDGNVQESLEAILAFNRVCERTSLGPNYANQSESRRQFYDLLIRWGELPNQTVDTLRPVIRRLEYDVNRDPEKDVSIAPVPKQSRANMHWTNYRYWGGEREWFSLVHKFYEIDNDSTANMSNLPWFGRFLFASSQQRLNRLRKKMAVEEFPNRYWYRGHYTVNFGVNWRHDGRQWMGNSTISDGDRRFYGLDDDSTRFSYVPNMVFEETLRRYTLTRLGLMSYRTEHGRYPQTLEQLASYFQPNRYQTTIPKTALGGQDFGWFPKGLPEGVFYDLHSSDIELLPDRPILFPFAVDRPIDFSNKVEYEVEVDKKDIAKEGVELPIVRETYAWFANTSNIYLPDNTLND